MESEWVALMEVESRMVAAEAGSMMVLKSDYGWGRGEVLAAEYQISSCTLLRLRFHFEEKFKSSIAQYGYYS